MFMCADACSCVCLSFISYVGYPYTKYMCANDNIDGAAAWLVCSAGTARKLGVSEDKWAYCVLHHIACQYMYDHSLFD